MAPADEQVDPDESLKRMSFGDHLDELRKRLFKALIAVAICIFAMLPFKEQVGEVILGPYRDVWRMSYQDYLEELDEKEASGDWVDDETQQGYFDFNRDNRQQILAGEFPHFDAIRTQGGFPLPYSLAAIGGLEDFWTFMMMSLILSILIASPVVIYQGWSFIAAGLYQKERKVVYRYMPLFMGLLGGGVLFGYFVVVPFGLYFLIGLMFPGQVGALFTVKEYFNLLFMLTAALGIVFQLPLVMLALTRIGIVTHQAWVKNWRYVLLGMFVTAALFTPPDPFTQMMMALPMCLLFLFGLVLTRGAERRSQAATRVE